MRRRYLMTHKRQARRHVDWDLAAALELQQHGANSPRTPGKTRPLPLELFQFSLSAIQLHLHISSQKPAQGDLPLHHHSHMIVHILIDIPQKATRNDTYRPKRQTGQIYILITLRKRNLPRTDNDFPCLRVRIMSNARQQLDLF